MVLLTESRDRAVYLIRICRLERRIHSYEKTDHNTKIATGNGK